MGEAVYEGEAVLEWEAVLDSDGGLWRPSSEARCKVGHAVFCSYVNY